MLPRAIGGLKIRTKKRCIFQEFLYSSSSVNFTLIYILKDKLWIFLVFLNDILNETYDVNKAFRFVDVNSILILVGNLFNHSSTLIFQFKPIIGYIFSWC